MDTYESVLLVKPEVFVFRIPPRTTNRGYRAADWNLAEPTWTGRMRLVTKGNECSIKLEDKNTGELFAKCPIDVYPGVAIEPVLDSSRYFVLRVQDDDGKSAFLGIGFGDRSDSFDLNVALQDHFKWIKKEKQISEEPNGPTLDLGFKEGETIKINMKITKKDGAESASKSKPRVGGGLGLLPPPPSASSSRLPAPPGCSPATSPAHAPKPAASGGDSWGEFASAQSRLESIHENIKEENPLMYRIIEKLENMYLPLKFHHKGRLEVEDKLKSGFYLVNGVWKGTFPFLEILEKQSISTFYTIYVVDYSFGQKSDQVDMVSSDITDIWDLYSLSDPVSHLIKYGRISPDPFLNNLIHIAGTGMYLTAEEDTLSCSQKARSLAKFVERQTSGIILDATPEQYTHYYKYHISCLKRKLGTNIIPIGYVRSGKHCERALLFKALADKIGLPATLVRGKNGIYWNEIPTVMNPDQLEIAGIKNSYMTYAIIDLMDNVGQLLLPGSREAKKYCKWDLVERLERQNHTNVALLL